MKYMNKTKANRFSPLLSGSRSRVKTVVCPASFPLWLPRPLHCPPCWDQVAPSLVAPKKIGFVSFRGLVNSTVIKLDFGNHAGNLAARRLARSQKSLIANKKFQIICCMFDPMSQMVDLSRVLYENIRRRK